MAHVIGEKVARARNCKSDAAEPVRVWRGCVGRDEGAGRCKELVRKWLEKGIGTCGTEVGTGDVIVECWLPMTQQMGDMWPCLEDGTERCKIVRVLSGLALESG